MSNHAAIGIDLGGTNCRGALVTPSGRVAAWRSIASEPSADLDTFLGRLAGFCRQLQAAAKELGLQIVGVGCGAAGVVSPRGNIHSAPNLKLLDGYDLQGYLGHTIGLPALVTNDANAIAWGESLFGAGQDFDSFLTITLGTGVGGGLVFQRRLWPGSCGGGGEIGHLAVEADGRRCGCGSHGCLEQYASAHGIVQNFLDLGGPERVAVLGSVEIARLARHGDSVAMAAFALAGRYLGQAIAGIANLLNPEGVVIGGGLSSCFDLLGPSLREELALRAFAVNSQNLQLVTACLGERAGIIGAAHLLFDAAAGR